MWLPPLNQFPEYFIYITAEQNELPPKDVTDPRSLPHFAISVQVRVRFCNDSGSDLGFRGLDYPTKVFRIPCRDLIRRSAKKVEKILGAKLLSRIHIPFRLDNVMFVHKSYGEDYRLSSLFSVENWVKNLQEFLHSMTRKSYNVGQNVLPLSLTIDKSVNLPDKFYKVWRSWFDYSIKQDPNFEDKYRAAISRPRTDEESLCGPLFNLETLDEAISVVRSCGPIFTFDEIMMFVLKDVTTSSVAGDRCPICLEDFCDGNGGPKSLSSCAHTFHGHCIKDWFRKSQVCPMCRCNLSHLFCTDEEAVKEVRLADLMQSWFGVYI